MQSVLKLCTCVCVCVSGRFVPSGLPSVPPSLGRNGRTACSSFLQANDLFKNLTLSLSLSRLALALFWELYVYIATMGDKLFSSLRLKDHPVLENISRVGDTQILCVLYIFFFESFERYADDSVCVFFFFRVM